jgi:hypothetical protein
MWKMTTIKPSNDTPDFHIADLIENRSPAGPNDSVQGWHNLLKKFCRSICSRIPIGMMMDQVRFEVQYPLG